MFADKTNRSLGLMIIILISLSSSIFSQAGCSFDKWEKNAGTQWWNNNVPEKYVLTAKQIKKFNKIRSKYSEKILPLQDEFWGLKAEFSRYLGQSEIDIRRIRAFRKKIVYLEEKILDLQLEVREKISRLMTEKQKKYFHDGGYGWWDKEENWWHSKNRNKADYRGHKRINPHGCD